MPPNQAAEAEAAIEAGRKHYTAKRYKPALIQFTKAMSLCPCTRGTKRERCSCKNFEEVALKDGSIFKEAMYNCKCHIGQTFNKCDKSAHIQALDYRAATFEQLEELERAKKDAEWMLELAPRLPDGYLRLGKVARLQKKSEFAWKVYNAGIDVGTSNGTLESTKMQQLIKARVPLQLRFTYKDPLKLPMEIIQLIFESLDLITRIRCLRVCKPWNAILSARGNERLWRSLCLVGTAMPRRPLRFDSIKKLLKLSHNDVREITIEASRQSGMTQAKFLCLLNGARNLESLDLRRPFEPLELPVNFKHLKRVALDGFGVHDVPANNGSNHYYKFLNKAAECVQDLHLIGLPAEWGLGMIPSMPNLKLFCVKGLMNQRNIRELLPILVFLAKAPNLEQLLLENITVAAALEDSEWKKLCPKLQALRVSQSSMPASVPYRILTSLNGGKLLQHLDFSMPWEYVQSFNRPSDSLVEKLDGQVNKYENLRSVRFNQFCLCPEKARQLFDAPIKDGKMESFDIVFPLEGLNQQRTGQSSREHLDGYGWLRGATSIRCMGFFQFTFDKFPRNENDLPLPSFLATFPNLEVLEIKSDNYGEAELCTIIKAILKVTHLKTLYQSTVRGVLMDQLKKLADSHGVNLEFGERPRQWPYPII